LCGIAAEHRRVRARICARPTFDTAGFPSIFHPIFELVSDYASDGVQPAAIEKLTAGILAGAKHQTLLGVTVGISQSFVPGEPGAPSGHGGISFRMSARHRKMDKRRPDRAKIGS